MFNKKKQISFDIRKKNYIFKKFIGVVWDPYLILHFI